MPPKKITKENNYDDYVFIRINASEYIYNSLFSNVRGVITKKFYEKLKKALDLGYEPLQITDYESLHRGCYHFSTDKKLIKEYIKNVLDNDFEEYEIDEYLKDEEKRMKKERGSSD
jgi:hypothetical protein